MLMSVYKRKMLSWKQFITIANILDIVGEYNLHGDPFCDVKQVLSLALPFTRQTHFGTTNATINF